MKGYFRQYIFNDFLKMGNRLLGFGVNRETQWKIPCIEKYIDTVQTI